MMKVTNRIPLEIRVVNRSPHPLPCYKSTGSAGMDLYAWLPAPLQLAPGQIERLGTGIYIAIPEGWEGQVRTRSGLGIKKGVIVVNTPGTIDADYRGEVKVGLINLSSLPYTIADGERIAQLIISPCEKVVWREVEALEDTERGIGGFGSTGKKG